jgi:hypothetical protein
MISEGFRLLSQLLCLGALERMQLRNDDGLTG